MLAGMEEVGTGLLDRLDAMQRVAASAPGGPMLIVAGPGTGKTRTLTHRIAYLCAELGVRPDQCLAITFTRRAAEEVGDRLRSLLGPVASDVTVATFHALALAILREHPGRAGLGDGFRVADDADPAAAIDEATTRDGGATRSAAQARRALAAMTDDGLRERYLAALRRNDLVDVDELVTLAVDLLRGAPDLVAAYRRRWSWTFVDEYQDVDPAQFDLLRLLCPADGNLCAIGDPDQAIYAFRGADVSHFQRFAADYVDARVVRLARNYRSSAPILATAVQAIAPTTLVPGRRIDPARSTRKPPRSVGIRRQAPPMRPISWYGQSTRSSAACPIDPSTRSGGRTYRSGRGPVLRGHRGALPDRRTGRADPRSTLAGRRTRAEAIARPAA